jgi:zinc transport system substrate-binding protein
MAGTIAEACIAADQANSGRYAANLSLLNEKLDALHNSIAKRLAPYAGRRFFVFHPSFGYFAHDYNLHQEAVEVSGNIPSPRQLSQLISQAKEDGVKVIFVQPQFDATSAKTVADAIGGEVVPLDALAEDVGENLDIIAGKIQSALSR